MEVGMKYTKGEIAKATEYLHEYLKAGDKVYTILRQVSRSGMSRHISVLTSKNYDITYLVAKVLGERRNEHDGGLVVSGCGMDMGFEVVYRLGYALYPKGYKCLGKDCRNPDHYNKGIRDNPPKIHTSGGYAFKQEWL
jgi:hypothetical protein